MYYSYAMGMNEEIYELEKEVFIIEKDDNDFMITFNKNMANKYLSSRIGYIIIHE